MVEAPRIRMIYDTLKNQINKKNKKKYAGHLIKILIQTLLILN